MDSEHFMSTGALDNVSVPNESTLVAPPPPDSPGQHLPSACPKVAGTLAGAVFAAYNRGTVVAVLAAYHRGTAVAVFVSFINQSCSFYRIANEYLLFQTCKVQQTKKKNLLPAIG